jgi:hypothetical protein
MREVSQNWDTRTIIVQTKERSDRHQHSERLNNNFFGTK